MDRSEIRDAEIGDAIESCRPGSDDLSLPEMAPLAEMLSADTALSADTVLHATFNRIQRLDRRIAAATRDVPVPAGLVERVLARLQVPSMNRDADRSEQLASTAAMPAIAPALAAAANVATADDKNSPSAPPSLARRRFARRAWSLAAVGTCMLVAAAFVTFWRPHAPLSADSLIAGSGDWSAQVWNRAKWNVPPAGNVLTKYPLSAAVRAQPLAWTDVSSIVGEDAVAYDVSIGGHRAALFVIPCGDPVADPAPPIRPQSSTGGQMIGCWQSGGMVYVLVVEGDARAYESLVRPSARQPFA